MAAPLAIIGCSLGRRLAGDVISALVGRSLAGWSAAGDVISIVYALSLGRRHNDYLWITLFGDLLGIFWSMSNR